MAKGNARSSSERQLAKLGDAQTVLYRARSVTRLAIKASTGRCESEDQDMAFQVLDMLIEQTLNELDALEGDMRTSQRRRPVGLRQDSEGVSEVLASAIDVVKARRAAEALTPKQRRESLASVT